MVIHGDNNPYEIEIFQNMPDMILRPGGFALTERLLELSGLNCRERTKTRILDVGCGFGASVKLLREKGFDAIGADKSAEMVNFGNQGIEGEPLITANAENLPFEASSFDSLLFECSFSTMNGTPAICEAQRVLKPGGLLLLSDVFKGTNGTGDMRSLAEFSELLCKNGFEITHTEDKTKEFESFIAQVIMSTGSLKTLFCCGELSEIKKSRPVYMLVIARKGG